MFLGRMRFMIATKWIKGIVYDGKEK